MSWQFLKEFQIVKKKKKWRERHREREENGRLGFSLARRYLQKNVFAPKLYIKLFTTYRRKRLVVIRKIGVTCTYRWAPNLFRFRSIDPWFCNTVTKQRG